MVLASKFGNEIALISNNRIALKFDKAGRHLGTDLPVTREYIVNAERVHIVSVAYSSVKGDYEIAVEFDENDTLYRYMSTIDVYTAMEIIRKSGGYDYMFSRSMDIEGTKCMQVLFVYNRSVQKNNILAVIAHLGGKAVY